MLITTTRNQVSHWENSRTLFAHTLASTRNNPVAHFNFGAALAEHGDIDHAMFHYRESLKLEDSDEVQNNLGRLLAEQGRIDDAITHFEAALRFNGKNPRALNNLGKAYIEKGHLETAVIYFRKALKVAPNDSQIEKNLANALILTNEHDQAIFHFQQVLSRDSRNTEALVGLGEALARANRLEEAIDSFHSALAISPGNIVIRAHIDRLQTVLENRRRVKADLLGKITQQPDNPEAYFRLGLFCQQSGIYDEAAANYRKAMLFDPNHFASLFQLATIHSIDNELEQAAVLLMTLVQIQPENPVIYYNLACIRARQKRIEEAIAYLKTAIEYGYGDLKYIRADEDLVNIRGTDFFKKLFEQK